MYLVWSGERAAIVTRTTTRTRAIRTDIEWTICEISTSGAIDTACSILTSKVSHDLKNYRTSLGVNWDMLGPGDINHNCNFRPNKFYLNSLIIVDSLKVYDMCQNICWYTRSCRWNFTEIYLDTHVPLAHKKGDWLAHVLTAMHLSTLELQCPLGHLIGHHLWKCHVMTHNMGDSKGQGLHLPLRKHGMQLGYRHVTSTYQWSWHVVTNLQLEISRHDHILLDFL